MEETPQSMMFQRYLRRIKDMKTVISEIEMINKKISENSKKQKREVDNNAKARRDKETQRMYSDMKRKFKTEIQELQDLSDEIKVCGERALEEKDKEMLVLNVQSAKVNLEEKLNESHRIYNEYKKDYTDVLVRQFENIDGGRTDREEIERIIDEDPQVGLETLLWLEAMGGDWDHRSGWAI